MAVISGPPLTPACLYFVALVVRLSCVWFISSPGFVAAGLVSYIGLELVLDHTFYQRGPEEESGMIQINSRVISALLENTANLESVKFTFKNKDVSWLS